MPSMRLRKLLLVLATLACYADSLNGSFLFDDRMTIVKNPAIELLWDPGRLGSLRGLVDFSFAANYAIGGLQPTGYHVVGLPGIGVCASGGS